MARKLKPSLKELTIAGTIEPGTSKEYLTGDWRTFKPVLDEEKCTKCGLCWVYCPDAAIDQTEDGRYTVNLDYCKGCGICIVECPVKALSKVEEGE
jgi:pyruvate ferredoxin oxidoreductase delta subunit